MVGLSPGCRDPRLSSHRRFHSTAQSAVGQGAPLDMARITIEDCMEKVPNRFQLVRMAAIRAKQLKKGARPLIEQTENKAVVTSLREIAAGLVKPGDIEVPPAPLEASVAEEETATQVAAEGAAVEDVETSSDDETPEPVVEG